EQAIPVVQNREVDQQNTDDDENADELLAKETCGARVFSVAQQAEHGDEQNGPEGAGENGHSQERDEDEPGEIALPQGFAAGRLLLPAKHPDQQRRNRQDPRDRRQQADRYRMRERVFYAK